jgi:hypothetical protein
MRFEEVCIAARRAIGIDARTFDPADLAID